MLNRALGIAVAAAALMTASPAPAMGQGQMPQGKEVTITGTVIDVSCKFGQGLSGDQHRMCSQICADAGLPLAVLGDDGTLYIPTTAEMPGKGQNGLLKEHAEHRVTIKGKAFKAGGAQAIQIASIAMAK